MVELFATEKVRQLIPRVREFIHEELIPIELNILNKPFSRSENLLEGLRQKVKSEGLWAPHLSVEDGGLGLNMIEFALLSEEMAQSPLGHYVFNCQAPDIGNMELLEKYASEPIKERFLKPLLDGQIRSCFSMTEPEFAGSNPVMMGTLAEKQGKNYVINGHKWFTSSADGASFAVVMAVTDPDAEPYKRASMIIVPTDTPGFKLVRNIPIMGETGDGYISHAEIKYENCTVPRENLIGNEGEGFVLAQERLGPGRIHHCMRWIGICERAFDMMCRRAATRELSPGKMLGEKQTIQNWIAESRAEINAARYMVLHTAKKLDEEGTKAARLEISTIKFYVADILMKVLDRAIQTHGALGITDDTVLSFWYRHERGARIYDGPDEVHKSSLARNILKRY
jgi:alkylation response protein AidB-like acyl-CoA dehydrogenase